MKDHQLRALIKVADTGSIRAAARELNLSQSALTKALRELEEDVGASLLSRSYMGVEFTPAGQALLTRARLARSALDKARDDIALLRGGSGVQVAVALTPLVAATMMHKAFKAFERVSPDVAISVFEGLPSVAIPGLLEGRIDFALVIADAQDLPYEVQFEQLASLPTAIACSARHPLAAARRWSQLKDARWALNLSAGSQGNQLLQWLKKRGLGQPDRITNCASPFLMMELMRRADRLCVGPRTLFTDPTFGQGLTVMSLDPQPPDMALGVLTLKGVPLTSAARHLLTLLERQARAG